ncbi:response regulator transcription factor [Salinispirillum sp. LH 10-3-1]|uniref:Response regulator transcription factor n=1 Tax=Salinispirillum sp. LH 10-3-1 TaxID=2952525 RepID=A0AB38YH41_9GAMM
MARILVADDHPLFRDALRQMLTSGDQPHDIAETDSLPATLAWLKQEDEPDLLVLDLAMPGSAGLLGLQQIRRAWPALPVVVVSGSDQALIVAGSQELGALGFCSKSAAPDALRHTLEQVLLGELCFPAISDAGEHTPLLRAMAQLQTLTPAQYDVAMRVSTGELNKTIAWDLGISEATVKAHLTTIFRKLGLHGRAQLVSLLSQLRLRPE